MIPRWLLLSLLLPPCLAQYAAHPDMTFNDNNDRFDVGNIIAEQNRMYHDQASPMELDGRRYGDLPLVEFLRKDRQRYEAETRGKSVRRILAEQEDRDTYARNLAAFQRQTHRRNLGRRTSRKSVDTQNTAEALDKLKSSKNLVKPLNFRYPGFILDNENLENPLEIGSAKNLDITKPGIFFEKNPILNLENEPVKDVGKILESLHFEDSNNTQKKEEDKYTEEESLLAKLVRDAVLKHLQGSKGLKTVRRRLDPDNDLLLQYAVPINLKINGYLEVPQDV